MQPSRDESLISKRLSYNPPDAEASVDLLGTQITAEQLHSWGLTIRCRSMQWVWAQAQCIYVVTIVRLHSIYLPIGEMSAGGLRINSSNSNPQCWPPRCRWGAMIQYYGSLRCEQQYDQSQRNRDQCIPGSYSPPLNLKPPQLLLPGWAAPGSPLQPAAWLQTAARRPGAWLPLAFAA